MEAERTRSDLEGPLDRIELALRDSQRESELQRLESVRAEVAALVALRATVDCALIELGGDASREGLVRFVTRIRAGLDPDLGT